MNSKLARLLIQAAASSPDSSPIDWTRRNIKTCPCGQLHLDQRTERHTQQHMEGVKYQCPVDGNWYFIGIMPVSFS